jgi:predicted transcriptional regulator YheO
MRIKVFKYIKTESLTVQRRNYNAAMVEKLYKEGALTVDKICMKLGISPKVLYGCLKLRNVKPSRKIPYSKAKRDAMAVMVEKLYKEGALTVNKICVKLGISPPILYGCLKLRNVKLSRRPLYSKAGEQ